METEIFNNGKYVIDYIEGTVIKYVKNQDINTREAYSLNQANLFILEKNTKQEISLLLLGWNIPLRVNQEIRIYRIYFIKGKNYYCREDNYLYIENLNLDKIFENPQKVSNIISLHDKWNDYKAIPIFIGFIIILSAKIDYLGEYILGFGFIYLFIDIFIFLPLLVKKIKNAIRKHTKYQIK